MCNDNDLTVRNPDIPATPDIDPSPKQRGERTPGTWLLAGRRVAQVAFRRFRAPERTSGYRTDVDTDPALSLPERPPPRSFERALSAVKGVDPRVVDAMLRVPREHFAPSVSRLTAYDDNALPIGGSQTISQPSLVALMISLLQLPDDRSATVLDVGSGSGYTSAILSRLAEHVVAVERVERLLEQSADRLHRLGYLNIDVVPADPRRLGLPERAPFDAILVSAGAPSVPGTLLEQLAPGGMMVVPVGDRSSQQLAVVHRSVTHREFTTENSSKCRFVPLIGPGAWPED